MAAALATAAAKQVAAFDASSRGTAITNSDETDTFTATTVVFEPLTLPKFPYQPYLCPIILIAQMQLYSPLPWGRLLYVTRSLFFRD